MNKTELIYTVCKKTGLPKNETELTISTVFDTIASSLASGEKVKLVNFGTFEVKERHKRVGRNPRTGGPVEIPASRLASFKAGKALKEAITK